VLNGSSEQRPGAAVRRASGGEQHALVELPGRERGGEGARPTEAVKTDSRKKAPTWARTTRGVAGSTPTTTRCGVLRPMKTVLWLCGGRLIGKEKKKAPVRLFRPCCGPIKEAVPIAIIVRSALGDRFPALPGGKGAQRSLILSKARLRRLGAGAVGGPTLLAVQAAGRRGERMPVRLMHGRMAVHTRR